MNRNLKNDYLYAFCNNQKLYQILLHKKIIPSEYDDSLLPKCLKFRKYYFKSGYIKDHTNGQYFTYHKTLKELVEKVNPHIGLEQTIWINKFTFFNYIFDIKNNQYNILYLAAYSGILDIIKYVCKNMNLEYIRNGCISVAALEGNTSVVKWFYKTFKNNIFDKNSFDLYYDKEYNNNDKYYDKYVYFNINKMSLMHYREPLHFIDRVICNGHLHTLKYLIKIKALKLTSNSINVAIKNGHLHIAKWIYKNFANVNNIIDVVVIETIRNGHLEVIKWICETIPRFKSVKNIKKMYIAAINYQKKDIIAYLIDKNYTNTGLMIFCENYIKNNNNLKNIN